jgi:RecA-family ATPase
MSHLTTDGKVKRGITGSQILTKEVSRKGRHILDEYLAEGETMMLYAPTGQGKTINALMLGIAWSTGTDFYGWRAVEPFPVLFVEGGELGAYGIAERAQAIYRRKGIKVDDNFHLKAPTAQQPFTFDITDKNHQKLIDQYCEEWGIRAIIFDNYNSLRNEEDNEFMAWNRLEKWLNRLGGKGIASVIIHHTNKEGRQQSGAQRKSDYCDLILRIEKSILSTDDSRDLSAGKHYIEIEMEKFRWGKALPVQLQELIFHDGELELNKVDYHKIMEERIEEDFDKYGRSYINKKYKFLGYKIDHYLKSIEEKHKTPVASYQDMIGDYTHDLF